MQVQVFKQTSIVRFATAEEQARNISNPVPIGSRGRLGISNKLIKLERAEGHKMGK